MQKYEIIERIGEGAYGIVLKCRCNDPEAIKPKHSNSTKYSDIVAMKQFKDSDDNEVVKRTTMRQVKVLKMLSHPNIVELREAFRKKGYVYLIFEYVKNNLLEVLEKSPDGLDHEFLRQLIYQLIKGLAYLHSLNIIHRDIKPQNLLVSEENDLKICDFGFARIYKKVGKEDLTDYVATRWYRSPELLVGAAYNKQIDMWATGCIMGELIDGNPMFPGENQFDQLFLIQKCLGPLTNQHNETFIKNNRFVGAKFPQINNLETIDKRYLGKFSVKGIGLLKSLLKMNPSQRITASQALKHPYFSGLEEEEALRKTTVFCSVKKQSKVIQKQEVNSPITSTSMNDRKINGSMPFQSTVYHQFDQQKVDYGQHHVDNIFNVTKVQKIHGGKKKQQESFTIKGNNNYNSTNMTKSLGKAKHGTKLNDRHISMEKKTKRESQTKTQTGFYVHGGSIIPERPEEDHHADYPNNKIYNAKGVNSRNKCRKNGNLNTEEVIAEENEATWQSSSQLPFLASQNKSSESRHRGPNIAPINIIISNSTFHYKR